MAASDQGDSPFEIPLTIMPLAGHSEQEIHLFGFPLEWSSDESNEGGSSPPPASRTQSPDDVETEDDIPGTPMKTPTPSPERDLEIFSFEKKEVHVLKDDKVELERFLEKTDRYFFAKAVGQEMADKWWDKVWEPVPREGSKKIIIRDRIKHNKSSETEKRLRGLKRAELMGDDQNLYAATKHLFMKSYMACSSGLDNSKGHIWQLDRSIDFSNAVPEAEVSDEKLKELFRIPPPICVRCRVRFFAPHLAVKYKVDGKDIFRTDIGAVDKDEVGRPETPPGAYEIFPRRAGPVEFWGCFLTSDVWDKLLHVPGRLFYEDLKKGRIVLNDEMYAKYDSGDIGGIEQG
ncbi:hypothetical protein BJ508DRAFT_333630 [Ascobolus immersus RN42]|uniref:Uncharacterized protein n=1 Tax=Ascobolus immersus RN42 TaxID=1160509 RepID=A0A3N4HPW0_ASCIM|nr:hypothetical protein BJ508DRAFT_333630 [Ascobolus immersus RN42]